jgi:hypothetical protein
MRIIVYHSGYGCDTGCCGHCVEMLDGDKTIKEKFSFDHTYGDVSSLEQKKDFARKLIKEEFGEGHVKDEISR